MIKLISFRKNPHKEVAERTNIDAEKKKNEGNVFYKQQQYSDALKCYSEAIGNKKISLRH